jgi:hypothetical protein
LLRASGRIESHLLLSPLYRTVQTANSCDSAGWLLPQKSIKNTILSSQAVRTCHFYSASLLSEANILTGGAAGCIVAGRLAVADPNLRILVLEAGPTTYNDPAHTQPMRYPTHLAPGSRTIRVHTSRPSAALGGRSVTVQCGQCLGGGGSINCTSYAFMFS